MTLREVLEDFQEETWWRMSAEENEKYLLKALKDIQGLMITPREIKSVITRVELIPLVCQDSGQAEWSEIEALTLATAIHTAMLKKLEGER